MNRRESINRLGVLGMATISPSWLMSSPVQTTLKRQIPRTKELLPAVGLGTWQTFDVGESASERNPLREVLKTLVTHGGSVIDSSPMYGNSEEVVGDLSTELQLNDKLFIATKVWTSGLEAGKKQMQNSFDLLKRKKIDLMQIHNMMDWQTHLKTLEQWKEQGKIRYIGMTHYLNSAHELLEDIINRYNIDFIQVNYSLISRHAENRLLPAAIDKNVAVLINRPFEEGALFDRVKGKELPAWAAEFDCKSWGQFFLKFILSHPAVTCVIPGTSKPKHMLDNLGAGLGKLPDNSQRKRMIEMIEG